MDQITKAIELFGQGYMCSQAVFAAFSEQFGITEKQALKIGGCFGGGMNKGEVCGACTGALMVLGMKYGQVDLNDQKSRAQEKNSKNARVPISAVIFSAAIFLPKKDERMPSTTGCSVSSVPKWLKPPLKLFRKCLRKTSEINEIRRQRKTDY